MGQLHTKQCSKCKETKNITAFYRSSNSADKHQSWCKDCTRKANKINDAERNRYGRAVLRRLKTMKGCVHCGYKAHHAALEFNHRNMEEKTKNISSFAIDVMLSNKSTSKKKLKLELLKCDVVCAICHSILTYNQMRKEKWWN